MGKMPSRQVAHAVTSSCSSSGAASPPPPPSSSSSSSSSARILRARNKLPPASSHSNSQTTKGAHHHSQYKSDVGRFVYYFLREHTPASSNNHSSNNLSRGDCSPNSAKLVRKQPCQPHQLVCRPGSTSSPETMPRRKSTKKIIINASPTSSDGEKEPHTTFRSNGSPIISPRLIRNSLRDSKFELDGPDDDAAMTNGNDAAGANGYSNGEADGAPKRKVARSNGLKTAKGEDAMVAAQAAREAELAKNLEAEKAMTGLSGVQLWVHRLLMAHNQTLTSFGIERKDFPNTRLSLKQIEAVLNPIVALCNVMRADHFGIHVPTPQIARTMKDVHYWKLWESDTIDIGIFFMPPNSVIPLHNHPGMSVVTRVLYGSAKVSSFDLISEPENPDETPEQSTEMVVSNKSNVKWARVSREGEVGTESTLWLDPRRFNLHEIQANSTNGCALLDIMVPPYDNADRDCHHFKILEEKIMGDQRIVKMLESIMPDNHNAPSDNSTASSSPTMS